MAGDERVKDKELVLFKAFNVLVRMLDRTKAAQGDVDRGSGFQHDRWINKGVPVRMP